MNVTNPVTGDRLTSTGAPAARVRLEATGSGMACAAKAMAGQRLRADPVLHGRHASVWRVRNRLAYKERPRSRISASGHILRCIIVCLNFAAQSRFETKH